MMTNKKEYFEICDYIVTCKYSGKMVAIFKEKGKYEISQYTNKDSYSLHIENKKLYKNDGLFHSYKPSWLGNLI